MAEPTDEELLIALQRDPEVPFRTLYDRHSGPLYRYIYRFTANGQEAEEVLHDVFMQLLAGKFVARDGATLKSWLYTVSKNHALNRLKAARPSDPLNDEIPSNIASAEHQISADQVQKSFAQAEAKLPEDLKATWGLRKQGLDYQAIADQLAIPLGTVKSRFHRLVEHLRKELENEN